MVSAGCFYDGQYRYDADWPSCSIPQPLDLCSESSESENSNVIIAVPSLSESSHGWLNSPGYPDFRNSSSSCSWSLKAPHGYILAIGVEDIRVGAGNITLAPIKMSQPSRRVDDILIRSKDLGKTFLTEDNSLSIKSISGILQSWRLSYLVVEPT